MIRALLRRAAVALQRANDARSVAHQLHYLEEARRAFEAARRSAVARRGLDEDDVEADAVAARAFAFAAREMDDFESQLRALEDRLARFDR